MVSAWWDFADTLITTVIVSFMLKWSFPVCERNREPNWKCSLPWATQKVFSYPWFLVARSDLTALSQGWPHRGKCSSNCAFTQKTPTQRSRTWGAASPRSNLSFQGSVIFQGWCSAPGVRADEAVVDSAATHPWRGPDTNPAVHYVCFKTRFENKERRKSWVR